MKRKSLFLSVSVILLAGIILFITSCKKEDPEPPAPTATSIQLISGGSQAADAESVLTSPVEVLVKDQNGDALKGVMVNFAVSEGAVSSGNVITNSAGKASVTWTLGPTAGNQTLIVTAFKADGATPLTGTPLNITATANAIILEATSIELISGGDQSANINTLLTIPISVKVKDQNGDALTGATVYYAVTEGSVSSASKITDSNGNVFTNWTLGPTEGTQTLTVTSFKADGTTHLDNSPLLVIATAEAGNETGTVTDFDGNVYNTVTIGTQTWMVENLKTTKYNDGTEIPNVTVAGAWAGLSTPGYCWYENDIANKTTYGALYNWYTVNTAKLAPTGWHVPTDAEFATLTTYLGGETGAAGKLKEIGTAHWDSPNFGATNETGFTALPGGFRGSDGVFGSIGLYGHWWDATEYSLAGGGAYLRYMSYSSSNVASTGYKKEYGFSVRCVKD